ncbi:hypothetical protein [Flavobacterium lipolyticum]|uniref:Phage abortive infection protein n=1 Tax=Flavobacterium lipolyticum TaxID=2893754 RepID=A0ABS8M1M9_9FLAO|nr:hypothetical protein [Flavobacterium sp. F-126]MCC9018747.1 hypothetical protein [Flavobacterium sp. F-126]
MDEPIKILVENYSLSAYQVAWISIIVSILTFFITNWFKNYFQNKLLQRKLEIEHKFNEGKKIKETLAKYKIHFINACEDFNHRCKNLTKNHQENWLKRDRDYNNEYYYYHSFVYKTLVLFAWIKKIQKEMIYLDTTIASKEDLEFVKFLNVFPEILCDLALIEGEKADGNRMKDHFFRVYFEQWSDCVIENDNLKTYTVFIQELPENQQNLSILFRFFDGLSPLEDRKRWDRLHMLHLTIIVFLNNYGYDFQKTSKEKMREIITKPKVSAYLKNYFIFLDKYLLLKNKEVLNLQKITEGYILE